MASSSGVPGSSRQILPLNENYQPKKKKPRVKAAVVYSQPEITGMGRDANTQLVLIVDYLKGLAGAPMNLQDLDIATGGKLGTDPDLLVRFEAHERIYKNPKNGVYSYTLEQEAVASKEDLLKEIKTHTRRGGGLSVAGLKQRWGSAGAEIEKLEAEGLVLVTRTVKEGAVGQPKMVFWNDIPPTAADGNGRGTQKIEDEFLSMWNGLKWPATDADLDTSLRSLGVAPAQTTEGPVKANLKDNNKKKRRNQNRARHAKIQNTHLDIDLTKDYVPGEASAGPSK